MFSAFWFKFYLLVLYFNAPNKVWSHDLWPYYNITFIILILPNIPWSRTICFNNLIWWTHFYCSTKTRVSSCFSLSVTLGSRIQSFRALWLYHIICLHSCGMTSFWFLWRHHLRISNIAYILFISFICQMIIFYWGLEFLLNWGNRLLCC